MNLKTVLLLFWISLAAFSSYAQSEKYSALGFLPSGAGMRMVGAGTKKRLRVAVDDQPVAPAQLLDPAA